MATLSGFMGAGDEPRTWGMPHGACGPEVREFLVDHHLHVVPGLVDAMASLANTLEELKALHTHEINAAVSGLRLKQITHQKLHSAMRTLRNEEVSGFLYAPYYELDEPSSDTGAWMDSMDDRKSSPSSPQKTGELVMPGLTPRTSEGKRHKDKKKATAAAAKAKASKKASPKKSKPSSPSGTSRKDAAFAIEVVVDGLPGKDTAALSHPLAGKCELLLQLTAEQQKKSIYDGIVLPSLQAFYKTEAGKLPSYGLVNQAAIREVIMEIDGGVRVANMNLLSVASLVPEATILSDKAPEAPVAVKLTLVPNQAWADALQPGGVFSIEIWPTGSASNVIRLGACQIERDALAKPFISAVVEPALRGAFSSNAQSSGFIFPDVNPEEVTILIEGAHVDAKTATAEAYVRRWEGAQPPQVRLILPMVVTKQLLFS
jgi:hypothetical protein